MASKAITKSVTSRTQAININSPKAVTDFALELKMFIVKQNLYQEIQRKNFVLVEGWQFAGASLGLMAITDKVERIDSGDGPEIKYRAETRLVNGDGQLVGFGVAVCSNKEAKRNNADEYVIASMAQTRSIGKAYRNKLAWLMKLAGYEATPAEEVTAEIMEAEVVEQEQLPPMDDIKSEVDSHLSGKASSIDKIRLLKAIGKVSGTNLTDKDYVQLWRTIKAEAAA